eukprot:1669_1
MSNCCQAPHTGTSTVSSREAKITREKQLSGISGSASGSSSSTTTSNTPSFEENLALVKAFKHRFGHTSVNSREGYRDLNKFVKSMRKSYKNAHMKGLAGNTSALAEERFRRLDEIGFDWTVPAYRSFEERALDLEEFKNKFGHCDVRDSYNGYIGLSRWCSGMRSANRAFLNHGKHHRINPERIKRLNDIGFFWSVDQHRRQQIFWKERIKDLKEFKNEFGHCDVRFKYSNHIPLCMWCTRMRKGYKELMRNGNAFYLNFEKVKILNDLGFVWTPDLELDT